MIDGNLSMANNIVNETEKQNRYWADVWHLFNEMDGNFDRYPVPLEFDPYSEHKAFRQRQLRLMAIAERFIRMKYYR